MDQQIINGCKNNERAAQKAVYEGLFDQMFLVCVRYLKNKEDVHDVVNQGFMKVFKNVHTFRAEGPFEGWVRRIMVRQALDHLKSTKKYRETQQQNYAEQEYVGSVPNQAVSNITMQELLALVHELPPMPRAVFNLFAIEGFPHKDIAAELDITESTSRWHLNFARKQLQKAVLAQQIAEQ